jgi:DNA-binding transcriptional regulator YdaS (Cro superfamily)
MTPQQALAKAKKSAGCAADLARRLNLTPQSISKWERVPAERVLQVERETGVSRHDLRPDIYPRENA